MDPAAALHHQHDCNNDDDAQPRQSTLGSALDNLEYNRKLIALFAQLELAEPVDPSHTHTPMPEEFRNLSDYQSASQHALLLRATSSSPVVTESKSARHAKSNSGDKEEEAKDPL